MITTETIMRVWDDGEGVCIEARPDGSGNGVEIRTADEKSIEWFGAVNLTVSKEMALHLGQALIEMSK